MCIRIERREKGGAGERSKKETSGGERIGEEIGKRRTERRSQATGQRSSATSGPIVPRVPGYPLNSQYTIPGNQNEPAFKRRRGEVTIRSKPQKHGHGRRIRTVLRLLVSKTNNNRDALVKSPLFISAVVVHDDFLRNRLVTRTSIRVELGMCRIIYVYVCVCVLDLVNIDE